MASYVIVGASRGLGYQFLKTLSLNPSNTIVGLARSPDSVQSKVSADSLPSNVHVLKGDMTDPSSLQAAATEVSNITGGVVDYLIINGAILGTKTSSITPSGFAGQEELLLEELDACMHTNVAGTIFSVNAFINLVKASSVKKVIVISSGMADPDIVDVAGLQAAVPYAASKAATNIVVAKYASEYKSEGIVFLALSPGFVNTAAEDPTNVPPEVASALDAFTVGFRNYEPNFKGPITPEESVNMQLKVIEDITIKDTGKFLSHKGNKRWL